MKLYPVKLVFLLFLVLAGLNACRQQTQVKMLNVLSPSQHIQATFFLTQNGEPAYKVKFHDRTIIDTSRLGFYFKNMAAINTDFKIVSFTSQAVHNSWELPWGEQQSVENTYNELCIALEETTANPRKMNLIFRVFDDGMAFRYQFPEQNGITEALILEENTQFRFTGNHQVWWIPGDWDSYEHLYNHTPLNAINALALGDPGINQTTIMENAVHTPLTLKTDAGDYISIHEANLTNYSSMTLIVDTSNLLLQAGLVNSERLGYAVKRTFPFETPWRTIQLAQKPGDLIESKMILNLNEPNKLADISWIKPAKYNGIWWEMHLNKSGWDMEGGRHGATTANAKRYIDFAASHNLQALLVEGWNTGWDRWTGIPDREGVFDFVTPYPDYNLQEVVNYAHNKGIDLIMHHETSAAPRTYEQQLDTAYQLMQSLGIHTAKLGYVGKIIPDGEHHHGQWMVNHYRKVLETAARYQVAINIHEPIKPTGLRRTFPNLLSGEGVRGQEFNAWAADGGNPPEHLTIVPFTRMLAGPIDYTPGIFNIKLKPYKPNNQVNTTLAQQLALYVVIYSPVQMAADLPEYYMGQPAYQFINDVPVDWQESHVLDAEIGDFVTIARKQKNANHWFVGTITDENPRQVTINCSFLDEGINYLATVYKDGPDAHWDKNPTSLSIDTMEVNKNTKITVNLAPGGGAAISIMAKPAE